MDKDVLSTLLAANDEANFQGKTQHLGVHVEIWNLTADTQLWTGQIHPNTQYEYEVTTGGRFKFCAKLSDMAFTDDKPNV